MIRFELALHFSPLSLSRTDTSTRERIDSDTPIHSGTNTYVASVDSFPSLLERSSKYSTFPRTVENYTYEPDRKAVAKISDDGVMRITSPFRYRDSIMVSVTHSYGLVYQWLIVVYS